MESVISKAPIKKAAVIGAGSMGSGIAAQFANGGIPVVLLDIPAKEGPRNGVAAQGVERQLKAGGYMHPDAAKLVITGNTEDDLALLADADIVVEAIIEDLGAKHALYAALEKLVGPQTIVSSNTSTIRLAELVKGHSDGFSRNFVITHFFNPPRAMRLVELIGGEQSSPEVVERAGAISDMLLGKTIVACKDTPGFIANRIGVSIMGAATIAALEMGLSEEEADAIWGAPFGIPRTGLFGLHDLIGIDVMLLVFRGLRDNLPNSDRVHRFDFTELPPFKHLIDNKLLGVKTKAGFYKRIEGTRSREVLDLKTLAYRPEQPADFPILKSTDLRAIVDSGDAAGRYGWQVLSQAVLYAAEVAEEVANDIAAIDTAMELGYAWKWGPFKLADRVGVPYLVDRLRQSGETIPPLLEKAAAAGGFYQDKEGLHLGFDGRMVPKARAGGVLLLSEIRRQGKPVLASASANLWDMGEGVALFEIATKANVIEPGVLDALERALATVGQDFRALVIGNDNPQIFSGGGDLAFMAGQMKAGAVEAVEAYIARGQAIYQALKYAAFPVVGAAFGSAMGGGCEILLHCDAIVSHAELNAVFPEVNLGIIPAWGGTTQLLLRWQERLGDRDPTATARHVFDVVADAKASSSALYARDYGVLRQSDPIVMNRDRLLAAARGKAIELSAGYRAPPKGVLKAAGESGKAVLSTVIEERRIAAKLGPHGALILEQLALIVTGGSAAPGSSVGEDALLSLEREVFGRLARSQATLERVESFLQTKNYLNN